MAQTFEIDVPAPAGVVVGGELTAAGAITAGALEHQLHEINALLDHVVVGEAVNQTAAAVDTSLENRLAQVRLGMANSLFTALRCRDAATAAHSLRVALGCSAWGMALKLPAPQLDAIEVAALLHDIGKIGVPDGVLLKPGALLPEERALMDRHVPRGIEILSSCCASADVLEMVRHAGSWYDGSRWKLEQRGNQLPLGARILAIVDAFDSMTTPQVYRPAMSRDRAIQELCDFAGSQFDPELVVKFAELNADDQQQLHQRVGRRWLHDLHSRAIDGWWQLKPANQSLGEEFSFDSLHQQKLLENMYDGVIFLDSNLQVLQWNRGAERLSGISAASILQRLFTPSGLKMRDERGDEITDDRCPVSYALRSGVQSLRRLIIGSRRGRDLAVDMHLIPVMGADGINQGITLLLHDASGEASLEERCHNLYEQAIRDPLTQLANRAEFDRALMMFVEAHLERRLPCSLIMCDIDRFKQVNDTFGHQAGDEAIKSFAQILKSCCHPGDLVARYGGEEFVMICADCNNTTAASRAEQLRKSFHELSQPAIGGKCCSASFGVTELQPGDNSATMLNRADRALLMAKDGGRNMVVQLGSGMSEEVGETRRRWWFWRRDPGGPLLDKYLVTNVPLDITIEKLRGFVCDQQAEIAQIEGEQIDLVIQPAKAGPIRRRSDRRVPLLVELKFALIETVRDESAANAKVLSQTRIHVVVRPKKNRDRRHSGALDQARHVLTSLRSYLMATEVAATPESGVLKKVSTLLVPWMNRR